MEERLGRLENMVNHWNGRSVLVTGATGLLGSWLVEDLLGGSPGGLPDSRFSSCAAGCSTKDSIGGWWRCAET